MNRVFGGRGAAWAGIAGILAGCGSGGLDSAQNASLGTEDEKASYAIGLQVGSSFGAAADNVSLEALVRGIQDAIAEREPALPEAELQLVMQQFMERVQEAQMQEMAAAAERNEQAGATFLAENAGKAGVTTTASGLQYEVMRAADGPTPQPTDRVTIHYKGTLPDGTEFDSSYGRGEPATFAVGGVIPGFSEGLQLMQVGSQYRFVIPGELAYGPSGSPPLIGPNQTLVFEVELLEIAQ
jgi:FKBP-type peptidyl-prolyl cis-trans isomerase FkpA